MAKGVRLWMRGADGLKVYDCSALKSDDGHPLHAELNIDENKIRVAHTERTAMESHVFHELVHKAFVGIAAETREEIFGDSETEEEGDAKEEKLCIFLEHKLFPLLHNNGWLRFPKLPAALKKA